ncbi:MAG: ABC transporter permease, partial [Methanobacteriota archaeon]
MIDLLSAIFTAFTLITSFNPDVLEITFRTLQITFTSVLISTIFAIPLGAAITFHEFKGKKTVISLIQTLYALPTVIVGLLCYMMLSRSGPFGFLGYLFTPNGM